MISAKCTWYPTMTEVWGIYFAVVLLKLMFNNLTVDVERNKFQQPMNFSQMIVVQYFHYGIENDSSIYLTYRCGCRTGQTWKC